MTTLHNVEIKDSAVSISIASERYLGCDICNMEPAEVRLQILNKDISFDQEVGRDCARKYLAVLA